MDIRSNPRRQTAIKSSSSGKDVGGSGTKVSQAFSASVDACTGGDGHGWCPERWGSKLKLVPRILNLAKDKPQLIGNGNDVVDNTTTFAAAVDSSSSRNGPRRYVVWNADLHIGPVGDVKSLLRGHGVLVRSMTV